MYSRTSSRSAATRARAAQTDDEEKRLATERGLQHLVERGTLRIIRKPASYAVAERSRIRKFWKADERGEPTEPRIMWLVGTSHLSRRSADEVEEVIRRVEPQAVVVELCRRRAGIMTADNDASSTGNGAGGVSIGSGDRESTPRSVNAWLQSLVRDILSRQVEGIGRELNVLPGEEFRQAFASARRVGAEVCLGDRPIDITLKRCWSNMTWQEKLQMLGVFGNMVLQSSLVTEQVSQIVSEADDETNLDLIYAEVTSVFPSLVDPLFKERVSDAKAGVDPARSSKGLTPPRPANFSYSSTHPLSQDRYLAWAIKRSKAVTNCDEVVAVMGRGHLGTVKKEIERDYQSQHLTFKSVAKL